MAKTKRCFFCGEIITGPTRPIFTQMITTDGNAPTRTEYGHPQCAAMLDDDEDGDEEEEDVRRY